MNTPPERQRPAGTGRVESTLHDPSLQAESPEHPITKLAFEGQGVRIRCDEHGEAWFSAMDVCAVLGFGNSRQALESHVDPDDVQKLDTVDARGRRQRSNHVNESGLYALILGSKKPAARRFKRWVTREVLPAIHRTGSFGGQADLHAALNNPAAVRALLLGYTEKVIALQATAEEQAPKVAALDRLAGVDGSLAITDAAKGLKLPPSSLFKWLEANGWIYHRPGRRGWLAYQPRIQTGLLEHKVATITVPNRLDDYGRRIERVSEQVRVTPKGLARLAELTAQGVIHGR